MTDQEAITILARWIRETTFELDLAHRRIDTLEQRVTRLEHAARERALARRHWVVNGHAERV